MVEFPISGVETFWWLPPLVAFGIACLSSMGGVSGAFLLLPFQMSFLGFTGPAVSSTNLLYNIVSIPSGVFRYHRERRMVWSLAGITILGTLPGTFLGAVIRIRYLPDPQLFKPFAGLVLLYIAIQMARNLLKKHQGSATTKDTPRSEVESQSFTPLFISYKFNGEVFQASTPKLLIFCFVIGIVGGVYGVGGGIFIAPLLVTYFRFPVHTIAGATLFGTFVSSIAGVFFYWLLARFNFGPGLAIMPDWALGGLFGLGGAAGMYVGARLQKRIPATLIKIILLLLLLVVAVKYLAIFIV